MWSGQWPGPEPAGSGWAWASNIAIVLRAGPGLDILVAAGPGPGLIIEFAGRARAGSAQLLRARAGPGPQIKFAGRAWALISGPCRALVHSGFTFHTWEMVLKPTMRKSKSKTSLLATRKSWIYSNYTQ